MLEIRVLAARAKERAEEQASAARQQLAEAQELLRSNQQVIQWLNKELNEAQTGGRPYVNIPSRVAAFKPALHPSIKPGAGPTSYSPSATGSSAIMCDHSPLSSAGSSALAGASSSLGTDAPQPGKALSSLKSRAGMTMAEGAARDSTNATGGFAEYLTPAAPLS